MKCKWLRRWLHWVHRSVMSQLNGQLSRPAEGGDGHGRDGARPAAGAARERERRGGRRRRRRGDGGQDGGLAGGPRVPLVGVGRRRRRSTDRSGPRVTTVQQMLTFTLRNINRLFFPAHWQRKKKRKKMSPASTELLPQVFPASLTPRLRRARWNVTAVRLEIRRHRCCWAHTPSIKFWKFWLCRLFFPSLLENPGHTFRHDYVN